MHSTQVFLPEWNHGERGTAMFVLVENSVSIYIGNEENTIETVIDRGDHQFTGELNRLNDQPALVGARTTVPSDALYTATGPLTPDHLP